MTLPYSKFKAMLKAHKVYNLTVEIIITGWFRDQKFRLKKWFKKD